MAYRWKRSEAVVAQRVSLSQVGGFLGKKIDLQETEAAFLEKDGKEIQSFPPGKHKVSGAFSGSGDIVFVDKAPKVMRRQEKELWTKDDKSVIAEIEMRFMVSDAGKLKNLMMGRRDAVTLDDIWQELRKEVVSSSVAPVVKKKVVDKLIGERETAKELQVAAEVELRKKFEAFGLDLLGFTVEFVLPEDYKEYMRRRGDMKEEEERESMREEDETKRMVRERDAAEDTGAAETRESVKDEMERERIRREAEMGIEEEETQQDMKDALEGLELKEIKDRQKMLKEAEKKEMGLESLKEMSAGDVGMLKERYDSLKEVIGATEKKFLDRKIDKKTFEKLMQDYEKEKTEIEVGMKKKGRES